MVKLEVRMIALLALGAGCALTIDLDPPVDEPPAATIGAACETDRTETTRLEVHFPAREPGCNWGEGGNLEPEQSYVTARTEDVVALDMPAGVAICDVGFDFSGDTEQIIRYDDSFLLTLDDVVLTASYAPLVEGLDEDGHLRLYDWERLAGTAIGFEDAGAYCLGEAEGLSSCEIPPPETSGAISLDFGPEIVSELAEYAYEENRYEFTFVTVGDNDEAVDCAHAAFGFTVEVEYVGF